MPLILLLPGLDYLEHCEVGCQLLLKRDFMSTGWAAENLLTLTVGLADQCLFTTVADAVTTGQIEGLVLLIGVVVLFVADGALKGHGALEVVVEGFYHSCFAESLFVRFVDCEGNWFKFGL